MHSPLRFLPWILVKDRPIHLTLFVTRRCNARCPFCFYSGGNASLDEITLDEYKKISRSMGSLLWLALSGGEPLLRDDLAEICQTFYKNNKPSIILLPTNGLMPERAYDVIRQILKDCLHSSIVVKLSLDGPPEVHDRLRAVQGAYDKTIRTYELLWPLQDEFNNFELGVNTVFCADNQDHMDWVIDHVLNMKRIRTHTISLARGQMREQSSTDMDLQKYHAASERLARGLRDGSQPSYGFGGARLKAAQDVIQRRLIHRTATSNSRQIECYAGRLNLVLTETGEMFPCESFLDEHRLGNLRENNYASKDMLHHEGNRRIIQRIGRHCFCTHECYMMTNILFNPKYYPELAREYLSICKDPLIKNRT